MKRPAPSSEPLPNPRHEAFAHEVASGRSATQAYLNVYGTENRHVSSTGGSRLLRRKGIIARIKSIQKAGAVVVALSLQEIHDFLTRVVRTPAGQIDPSSDLCTRVKHTPDGNTDVWMPNKLACLRLSAKLQGFLDTARLAQTEAELPPLDPPPILTEERREILMARRLAAIEAYQKQSDDQPLPQEKPPERSAGLPTRDEPLGPRSDTKPRATVINHQPPPVQPGPTIKRTQPPPAGPWIPHWRQNRPSGPDQTQAEASRDAHGAPAEPPLCGPRAAALNSQPSTINRPAFLRVTPDSSSGIVII